MASTRNANLRRAATWRRPDDRVFVYGLCSDRDGVVRYVGSTIRLERRLSSHLSNPTNPQMAAWFEEVRESGCSVQIITLEVTNGAGSDACEKRWIDHFKQTAPGQLLNVGGVFNNGVGGRRQATDKVLHFGSGDKRSQVERHMAAAERLGVKPYEFYRLAARRLADDVLGDA